MGKTGGAELPHIYITLILRYKRTTSPLEMAAVPQRTLNWLYSILIRVCTFIIACLTRCTDRNRTTTTPTKRIKTPIGPTTMSPMPWLNTHPSHHEPMSTVSPSFSNWTGIEQLLTWSWCSKPTKPVSPRCFSSLRGRCPSPFAARSTNFQSQYGSLRPILASRQWSMWLPRTIWWSGWDNMWRWRGGSITTIWHIGWRLGMWVPPDLV